MYIPPHLSIARKFCFKTIPASFDRATTIVLTGLSSSVVVERSDEHLTTRQTIDKATGNRSCAFHIGMQLSVSVYVHCHRNIHIDGNGNQLTLTSSRPRHG